MKASEILGLNARTTLYSYQFNKKSGKAKAASKLAAKKALKKAGVPVPELYVQFSNMSKINPFNFSKLPDAFALKPSKGLGGEGIIVVKKRLEDNNGKPEKAGGVILGNGISRFKLLRNRIHSFTSAPDNQQAWVTTQKKVVTVEDLKLHIQDILEGAYSIGNVPDRAFVEEYVGRHRAFAKYAYRGTPDIRVIVFNSIPVMAMLRLPTKESGGRANLHQGAIGVGVDIASGVTTKAYFHGEYIINKPDTNKKLNGIKIPFWNAVLKTAVESSRATKLGYVGVDIVLHPEKGPMVLELNYQPGLSIQLANKAGLRRRLQRVEDLEVHSADHGVNIGKALFAAHFADRVKAEEGIKTISALEEIKIRTSDKKKHRVLAKIDTGAWRTSISANLARSLGLLDADNILWTKTFRNALGKEERPVISLTFWLAGRRIVTPASIAKRSALKFPVIIGRKNLKGFLVNPHIEDLDLVKNKKK